MSRRAVVAAAVGAITLAVLVLVPASAASAHDFLVASTPTAGSTITAVPSTFSVTMNTAVLDIDGTGDGFGLVVKDAEGRYYGDGCITITDDTVSTPAALGPVGDYQLIWQVVSADGHPVGGSVPFHYAPSAAATPSPASTSVPGCGKTAAPVNPVAGPPSSIALGDVLWIGGAVLAVGIAIGVTLLVVSRPSRRRPDDEPTTTDSTSSP